MLSRRLIAHATLLYIAANIHRYQASTAELMWPLPSNIYRDIDAILYTGDLSCVPADRPVGGLSQLSLYQPAVLRHCDVTVT